MLQRKKSNTQAIIMYKQKFGLLYMTRQSIISFHIKYLIVSLFACIHNIPNVVDPIVLMIGICGKRRFLKNMNEQNAVTTANIAFESIKK